MSFASLFKGKKDETVGELFSADAKPIERKIFSKSVRPSTKKTEDESEDSEEESEDSEEESESEVEEKVIKKQKKQDENYDLEARYFKKLLDEDKEEEKEENTVEKEEEQEQDSSDDSSDSEDEAPTEKKKAKKAETIDLKQDELSKAEKTVFVGNVPVTVVTSKTIYKKFKNHFSKIGKILSIRFRSISFNDSLPRKIAFAQKKFHNQRETLNAYIVYESKESSLKASDFYNGKLFENFHLRVDHINHPSVKDNKRTIFVGNLHFEEMEENLWKYFNKHCDNDVESVRIVRDSKTNIGKGFALIQFKDTLSVNKALLLNNKSIEENSRKLRISRAKANSKPSILSPNHIDNQQKNTKKNRLMTKLNDKEKTVVGRSKILGKADQATIGSKIIMEGERARKGAKIGKKPRHAKNRKPRIRERTQKFKQQQQQEGAKGDQKSK